MLMLAIMQAVKALSHPRLVPVFGMCPYENHWVVVTALMPRGTLRTRLMTSPPGSLELSTLVAFFDDLMEVPPLIPTELEPFSLHLYVKL